MRWKIQQAAMLLTLALASQTLDAVSPSATWISTTSSVNSHDLTYDPNWSDDLVPSKVARFNSKIPHIQKHPEADVPFAIDRFHFKHSASDFRFTFTGPGSLAFGGKGITGKNTDTHIHAVNSTFMSTPQIFFTLFKKKGSTIGSASLSAKNEEGGQLNDSFAFPQNISQIRLSDIDAGNYGPITAYDKAQLSVKNHGIIDGNNEAGQIFLKGSPFTAGSHLDVVAVNSGSGAMITSPSDTAQIVADGHAENFRSFFTAGNKASFTLENSNHAVIVSKPDTMYDTSIFGNNVGQIVFDGNSGGAELTVGNKASFLLTNEKNSKIKNTHKANDGGQIVLDGNHGTATFGAGNHLDMAFKNIKDSSIIARGFDAGQLVIDGDGGLAAFVVGDHAHLDFVNHKSEIYSGRHGHDAAQVLLDGNGPLASASFITGKNAEIFLKNKKDAIIASYWNTGQLVVDGYNGSATFVLGDHSNLTAVNEGLIVNAAALKGSAYGESMEERFDAPTPVSDSLVGQIVFDGSLANILGVSLIAGNDSSITAINKGQIFNSDLIPALIYFRDTTVYGNPTITAIDDSGPAVASGAELVGVPPPHNNFGIVFAGNSTAEDANIVIENCALVLETTNTEPFTIASLTGNSTSSVLLFNDFEIDTNPGAFTIFDGVIEEGDEGVHDLFIAGLGTQVLDGDNTFEGFTKVKSGQLILNGSVLHNVYVDRGILSGTGLVGGDLFINQHGIVAPGYTEIGTLTVGGDYFQSKKDTTYFAEINGAGQSSLIAIDGSATLGGDVALSTFDGSYLVGYDYLILHADDGLGDTEFNKIYLTNIFNPLIRPVLKYDPDTNVFAVLETDLLTYACTSNEKSIAAELDALSGDSPTEDQIEILSTIATSSIPGAFYAVNEIAGEQFAYFAEASQHADQRFGRRIFTSIRELLYPCNCDYNCCNKVDSWVLVEGGRSYGNSSCNARGYNASNWDISVGTHLYRSRDFFVGVAGDYEADRLNFRQGGRCTLNTAQGAIYGGYQLPGGYIFSDFIAGESWSTFKRPIRFSSVDRTAHSKPKVVHGTGYIEAGADFELCTALIQPFAGVDVGWFSRNHIREHGADSLNLSVHKKSSTTCNSYLGAHMALACSDYGIQVSADAYWQHRFDSAGTNLTMAFEQFGDSFTIKGTKPGRDGFVGTFNVLGNITECLEVYAQFNGECWDNYSAWGANAGLNLKW